MNTLDPFNRETNVGKRKNDSPSDVQRLPRAALLELFEVSDHAAAALQSGYAALTNREAEILPLIGRGVIPKTIAQQLGISIKTLDIHRNNLRRKLGVTTINVPRVYFLAKALGFRRVPREQRQALAV